MTVRNRKPNTNGTRLAPFRRGAVLQNVCLNVQDLKRNNITENNAHVPAGRRRTSARGSHDASNPLFTLLS